MQSGWFAPHLKSIVCPTAELHDTRLFVEGEVLHVHLAGGVVDGRWLPLHLARVRQGRFGGQSDLEVTVGTEMKQKQNGVDIVKQA